MINHDDIFAAHDAAETGRRRVGASYKLCFDFLDTEDFPADQPHRKPKDLQLFAVGFS